MLYDVVYLVKESPINEELRYSLRSVEENFPCRRVFFYGGCPDGIVPDQRVRLSQNQKTKWLNTTGMLHQVCRNGDISENFWLFNDDFFVMRPVLKRPVPYYDGDIFDRIREIEARAGRKTEYSKNLRRMAKLLQKNKFETKNYAVHLPMLVNRDAAAHLFQRFPNEPMFRCLYGNYFKIGGRDASDVKIYNRTDRWSGSLFLSTSDDSFREGAVGEQVREIFGRPSRWEI